MRAMLMGRFWTKVDMDGECWLWKGARDPHGYGRFGLDGRSEKAQRIAFGLFHGEMPPRGAVVMHICDNPPCVRPDHLRLGTQTENCRDMYAKGRNAQPRGERAGNVKLTEAQVRAIREQYAAGGTTTRKLGAAFGVSGRQISHITRGLSWRHVV